MQTINPPAEQGLLGIPFQVRLTWLSPSPVMTVNIDAKTAQRRVSGWASAVATSCGAGSPELVIERTRVFWRVPVIFTRQGFGIVGEIGAVDLDAQNGQMDVNDSMIPIMQSNAKKLAANLKSSQPDTRHA